MVTLFKDVSMIIFKIDLIVEKFPNVIDTFVTMIFFLITFGRKLLSFVPTVHLTVFSIDLNIIIV